MRDIDKIKEFILVYKTKLFAFNDKDEFDLTDDDLGDDFFRSWISMEQTGGVYYWLNNKEDTVKVMPDKEMLCFDVKDNKTDTFSYPIVVCGIHIYKDNVFGDDEEEEDVEIDVWGIVNNKEEYNLFIEKEEIKEVKYIFEVKDDILLDVVAFHEKKVEEFERYLMRTIHMKGDIIITDPCYIRPDGIEDFDWHNLEAFGFSDYLCHSTLYGDWSCHVFNVDTKEILGQFCADAGMFGVFYRDEVKKLYPDFEKDYGDWCYTVIEKFEGDVHFVMKNPDTIIVEGKGNINFESMQTGL